MKHRKPLVTVLSAAMLLLTLNMQGQKSKRDKETVIDQLKKIASWYQAVPVSMSVQLSQFKQPAPQSADTIHTDVKLGYGPGRFYLKSGLIEQFIDDTMQVIVNHDARMIHVYPIIRPENNGLFTLFDKQAVSDSMIQVYKNRYELVALPDSAGCRTVKLLSKTKLGGTEFRKEEITVVCDRKDFRPLYYAVVKELLVPLDEEEYTLLAENTAFSQRLLKITDKEITGYFLIRQEFMSYRIQEITSILTAGLPQWKERVVRSKEGAFVALDAYNDYIVSLGE